MGFFVEEIAQIYQEQSDELLLIQKRTSSQQECMLKSDHQQVIEDA